MTRHNIKYTYELLSSLCAESTTVAQVVRKLGLAPLGGANSHVKRRIEKFGIDTSHFVGQAWNKGRRFEKRQRSPENVLVKTTNSLNKEKANVLRRSLISIGREHVCEQCSQPDIWQGKPLVLQIDHKDGDWSNNVPENLQFLCPNCHSQTENFGTKNIRRNKTLN